MRRIESAMNEIVEIDARGLICPLPVLRARKCLMGMAQGAVLHITADDPVAVIDLPHFCAQAGHEVVDIREGRDGAHLYVIRRG